jgi:hypothetical protein
LVTQFECDKGHIFIYPAKKTATDSNITLGYANELETHVCPFCQSLTLKEHVEPQPEIASVVSVPLEEVDAKLAEGYTVKELYAKTATLIKNKIKEA